MDGVWKKIITAIDAETTQINSRILIVVLFVTKSAPAD